MQKFPLIHFDVISAFFCSLAKPIRPGHNPNQPAIHSNSLSTTSVDSQVSSPSIIRATSPSKIPIVPAGSSDRATPVIRGGLRSDGEAIVGGSGVSQRIKNAVGSDTLPRSRSSRGRSVHFQISAFLLFFSLYWN